jgi:hypothetical protein
MSTTHDTDAAVPAAVHRDPLIETVPLGEFNIHRLRYVVEWAIEDYLRTEEALANPTIELDWHWDQNVWGQVDLRAVEEVDPAEAVTDDDGDEYLPVTCATACCIAGNAVITAGDRFLVDLDYADDPYYNSGEVNVTYALTTDGEIVDIKARGRRLLGLDREEADLLFNGSNGIGEVCWYAAHIAQEHGYHLALPAATPFIENFPEEYPYLAADYPVTWSA